MNLAKKCAKASYVKKAIFKPFDMVLHKQDKEYYIKVIPASKHTIITFHSKEHVSVKTGRLSHGRFMVKQERIISLTAFSAYKDKVLLFRHTPYKVLHQINEADIITLKENTVYDYTLVTDEKSLEKLLN